MDSRKDTTMKTVFTIVEHKGRSYWTKVGIGFVNNDGSLSLKLEALPVNGQLQVRDYESREDFLARRAQAATAPLPSFADPPGGFGGSSLLPGGPGGNGAANYGPTPADRADMPF